jgi:hypothetical protein
MLRRSIAAAFVICVGLTCAVYSQDAGARTRGIVASLDKTKYKKKDKGNISIEVYVNIKNEAVIRDAFDYGGNYTSEDSGCSLTLQVDRGGKASGAGFDSINDRRMGYTLKDASITGALLTGTKVYENGEQQPFEAVFVNRTIATGKNENEIASRETKFGLGYIQKGEWSSKEGQNTNWTSRVFLERR